MLIIKRKVIANVFCRAGYIEHQGRGIEKICDACKELGAEIPRYELRGNGIRVHFAALQSALIDEGKGTDSQSDDTNVSLGKDSFKYMTDKLINLSDKDKDKLVPIVDYLKTHDVITRQKAEELTKKSLSTVNRYLQRLIELGILIPEGKSVSTVYKRNV